MEIWFISILFTTWITCALQLPNENGGPNKRDVSYSYAATDVGSHDGIHVKTLTVIKNIADPPKKNVAKLWKDDGSDNSEEKIKVPDIPQIPEELFSEFNIFLNHEYAPKPDEKFEDDKKLITSETDKTEDENIPVMFNSNMEELSNDGKVAGEDLLNVNAEEIKETNENVKSEKLKPSEDKLFISSPILPEQAERSAKAQKERHHAKIVKSNEQPEKLFSSSTSSDLVFDKNNKYEPPYEKLFEPNDEKKSEPLLQLPISFDESPTPYSDKTVFPTKTIYNKKVFQASGSPGLGYKRDGIFIPKFTSSNYKPIIK